MDMSDIQRINELYKKSKSAQGLTAAEKEEQAKLRGEYVAAMRANLRGSLENIKIQNPDGSIIDVKGRHDAKYGTKSVKKYH